MQLSKNLESSRPSTQMKSLEKGTLGSEKILQEQVRHTQFIFEELLHLFRIGRLRHCREALLVTGQEEDVAGLRVSHDLWIVGCDYNLPGARYVFQNTHEPGCQEGMHVSVRLFDHDQCVVHKIE